MLKVSSGNSGAPWQGPGGGYAGGRGRGRGRGRGHRFSCGSAHRWRGARRVPAAAHSARRGPNAPRTRPVNRGAAAGRRSRADRRCTAAGEAEADGEALSWAAGEEAGEGAQERGAAHVMQPEHGVVRRHLEQHHRVAEQRVHLRSGAPARVHRRRQRAHRKLGALRASLCGSSIEFCLRRAARRESPSEQTA